METFVIVGSRDIDTEFQKDLIVWKLITADYIIDKTVFRFRRT